MSSRDHHGMVRLTPDEGDLCVRVLGELNVSRGGQTVPASAWRNGNARRLIGLLAVVPGHQVHREQIIDCFWPDADPQRGSNNLHQAVFHARRVMKSIGCDPKMLRLDRDMVSLGTDNGLWVDADAFEAVARLVQEGTASPVQVRQAIDLYTSELLPDARYEEWAAARREHLAGLYISLAFYLGELHESAGDLGMAEHAFAGLVLADPLHEPGNAALMRVYARTGRRHQALALYDRLHERLCAELGVAPSQDVVQLYNTISNGRFPAPEPHHVESPTRSGETPFVGRQVELHLMQSVVEHGFAGRRGIAILSGDPGVGKTRTAREIAGYARRSGAAVLWGNCYVDDGTPAYWPWVQIIREATDAYDDAELQHLVGAGSAAIRQIDPEIARRLPEAELPYWQSAEEARFHLFDSVARFFRQLSLRTPLLIVLDDLQWCDRSSLLLLQFLAKDSDQGRFVILGTWRDSDMSPDHPLRSTIAEISRYASLNRLPLAGLSEADVHRMINEMVSIPLPQNLANLVYRRTEGNPFFVKEMIRALRQDGASLATTIPVGVRDVIGNRLARLPQECREVLACAAVVGREFGLSVVEALTCMDREKLLGALEVACDAHLLERDAGGTWYRFTHALVRETTYAGLPILERAQLHRKIGETLRMLNADDLDRFASELAYHFGEAAVTGDIGPAVECGIRAGDQALERIAYSEAIDHYRRTLNMIKTHSPGNSIEQVETLLRLGAAHNHIGNKSESMETFLRAANIARALTRPVEFARAADGFAGLGIFFVSPEQRALLQEAISILPEEDSAVRARILARLAFEHLHSSDLNLRSGYVNEAERIARRSNDPSTLIFVLITRCWTVITMNNLSERLAISHEVMQLVEQCGEVVLRPTAHAMAYYLGYETGDIGIVDDQIEVFDELANRVREPQRIWLSLIFQLTRAAYTGQFDEVERLIEQTEAVSEGVLQGYTLRRRVLVPLVLIRFEQGRLDELAGMMSEVAGKEDHLLYWRTCRFFMQSSIDSDADSLPEFYRLLGEVECRSHEDPNNLASAVHLSLTRYVDRHPDTARRLLAVLRHHHQRYLFPKITHNPYGPIGYYTGRLASRLQCYDDAIAHLDIATDMNQRMCARPHLARSQYELANALYRRGDIGDSVRAEKLLKSAAVLADTVGMPVLLNEIATVRSQFVTAN